MDIPDISSQLSGFYDRVARQLGLGTTFVREVARGERESKQVEDALRSGLIEIAEEYSKNDGERH